MTNNITILYVDDDLDNDILYYLKECLNNERYITIEKEFHDSENLANIINSCEVKSADIILIDSKLFEKENAEVLFSGEEIKTIIRDIYPYKEVFVITQNDLDSDIQIIKKYNRSSNKQSELENVTSYYNKEIKCRIEASVRNIDEYRHVIQSEHNNKLKDVFNRLTSIINSEIEYSDLRREDIDKLVNAMKEINEKLSKNK